MTDPRPMSEIIPRLALVQTAETASSEPSTVALAVPDMNNLPARLDDETLAALERFSNSPSPPLAPCDDRHFAQCLRFMRAALPRRADDELSGELMATAYQRMLGHLTNEAMSFIAEKALERCEWFPTIAECLRIAKDWTPRPSPLAQQKDRARSLIGRERQTRFNEAMDALARYELDQQAIDALPRRWKLIAAEQCLLWAHADGSFTIRRCMAS